jgi:hypothetical protein
MEVEANTALVLLNLTSPLLLPGHVLLDLFYVRSPKFLRLYLHHYGQFGTVFPKPLQLSDFVHLKENMDRISIKTQSPRWTQQITPKSN